MTWGSQPRSHWQWDVVLQARGFPLPQCLFLGFCPRAGRELPSLHEAGHGHPDAMSLPALCPGWGRFPPPCLDGISSFLLALVALL